MTSKQVSTAGRLYLALLVEMDRHPGYSDREYAYRQALWQKADALISKMITESNKARMLEKKGGIQLAISINEALVRQEYLHPLPYERLRIIYAKQRRYQDAIRVCRAFLAVEQLKRQIPTGTPTYPKRADRFREWIDKYRTRLQRNKAAGSE